MCVLPNARLDPKTSDATLFSFKTHQPRKEYEERGEVDGREEGVSRPVIAHSDAPAIFDSSEQILDITLFVEVGVMPDDRAVFLGRYARRTSEAVGVTVPVGDHLPGSG